MSKQVVDALVRAGWKSEAPRPGATARAAYARSGSRLVAEAREVLWIVIDEADDRRVIGIEPAVAPEAAAKEIVRLQDELSIGSYLMAYGELGEIGDVSIMAWEQFDPEWR